MDCKQNLKQGSEVLIFRDPILQKEPLGVGILIKFVSRLDHIEKWTLKMKETNKIEDQWVPLVVKGC